jgi:hypothetical protein
MATHRKSGKKLKHTKKQKMYRMKGCSSNCKIKSHNHKKYLGGDSPQLSYPSADVPKTPNPFLAYVPRSRGGGTGNVYPAKAPPLLGGNYFINPQIIRGGASMIKGGGCAKKRKKKKLVFDLSPKKLKYNLLD